MVKATIIVLIGEAIRVRRHDVVIHSKRASLRDASLDAVRGGGDPRYPRQTCEQSLKNLGIEALDLFCFPSAGPNVREGSNLPVPEHAREWPRSVRLRPFQLGSTGCWRCQSVAV